MVDINVIMAIIMAISVAKGICPSDKPAGTEEAFDKAFAASDKPITIAILPVTVGGNTLSIAFWPTLFITNPATIDTSPDNTIPNCAIDILSFNVNPANCSAPIIDAIAAIYEKLDP